MPNRFETPGAGTNSRHRYLPPDIFTPSRTGMAGYDDVLISNGEGLRIVGKIPDTVSLSLEQEYANPLTGIKNDMLQGIFQFGSSKLGFDGSLHFDNEFFSIWQGPHPLALSFEIHLVAQNSVEQDIIQPLRDLMRLATARSTKLGKMLAPPITHGDRLSIRIGRILHLSNCLITNVGPQIQRPLLVGGIPSQVTVSMTVRTRRVFTQQQVNKSVFPGE